MLIFTRARIFNSLAALMVMVLCWPAQADWKVRFDRKATDMRGNTSRPFVLELDNSTGHQAPSPEASPEWARYPNELRAPSPRKAGDVGSGVLKNALPELMPTQEISLIMSDKGFAPKKLHLRRGESYAVTVVNVSSSHRNSSFVVPSLSIYEGTFFASPSTFHIQADQEGLFHFLSPESGIRGEIVVYESPQAAPSPKGGEELGPEAGELEAPSLGNVPLRVPTSAGRK